MNKQEVIQKTVDYVKQTLSGEGSGHDWWHVYRVWQNAKHIGAHEQCDMFVVELAALLHDISDWKFNGGDETVGAKIAKDWLEKLSVDVATIQKVYDIIATSSFKGAGHKTEMETIEGKIVQDADRLDAIGAIGIARAFAFGGSKERPLYEPEGKKKENLTPEEYKKDWSASTIHHFYEKLLLVKDRMNTKTAKKIADERHNYIEAYVKRFLEEWDGKA